MKRIGRLGQSSHRTAIDGMSNAAAAAAITAALPSECVMDK
jgi:hypothetical protein